jgi:hypothetical protein
MKIAIFSDLHDDWQNLKIFLNYCKLNQIEDLLFCGDLSKEETLEYLATNFIGRIYLVGGNADLFEDKKVKKYPNIIYQKDVLIFKFDELKIIAVHRPKELKEILEKNKEKFDFAFYGHTHQPVFKKNQQLIISNPGTLSGPPFQASFSILDSKKKILELKILSKI